MDIYSFINSKDIEAHCRKIGYHFNPLESAYLIWQSAKHSIEEKHKAYRENIETAETILSKPIRYRGRWRWFYVQTKDTEPAFWVCH